MSQFRPEIDFDHHSPFYAANWEALARQLHAMDFPMAWSPHHGGFWVLASWAEARRVETDWEGFSSDNDVDDEREGYKGTVIPPLPYPLILTESDPPFHTERRALEAPFFSPTRVRQWSEAMRRHLDEALDSAGRHDRVELAHDIVIPATARTTLHIVGFDAGDWQDFALSAHRSSYMTASHPDYPHAELARLRSMFRDYLARRRASPADDIVSALANGSILGSPLSDGEAESMLSALVFGGFDTTASAAVASLIWLDSHRDDHGRLLSDQAYLRNGVEELLRVFTPSPGVTRNATRDLEIGGRQVRRGERIYCWNAGANRDPVKFPEPERVDLGRANASHHLAYSGGRHRCLGASLGSLEVQLIVHSMLERYPDYRIDHAGIVRYPSFASIHGYSKVPMTFGRRRAAA